MKLKQYINLNEIYKESVESDTYKINHIKLSKSEVIMELIRNSDNYWYVKGLKPNFNYVRLIKKGDGIMMSDTSMERNTNERFIKKANGDVLIFGLGLGLIIFPLLNDESVKSITVVELYQDLIDVVKPKIQEKDIHNKVNIIRGDCFVNKFPKEKKFDTIYFDIWIDIIESNYEEQKTLTRMYARHINRENPNFYMDAWMKSYYKKEKEKEKAEEKKYKKIFTYSL
jgi:hypothetical protein